MALWARFSRRPGTRLCLVLLAVVVFFVAPWSANGSVTYPASISSLDSVSPPGSPGVHFDPGTQSIGLGPTAPGVLRVDLLRSDYSFQLSTELEVGSQSNSPDSAWQMVTASVAVPSGGRFFTLLFGVANTTVDLADVSVAVTGQPNAMLYNDNFTQSPGLWSLGGTAHYESSAPPPLRAIEISANNTESGYADTYIPAPIPQGASNLTISGLIRFVGPPGPFEIALHIQNSAELNLEYVADWSSWVDYYYPPIALSLLLWTASLGTSILLAFVIGNESGGTLVLESAYDGAVQSVQPIAPYRIGEVILASVDRVSGQYFDLRVVVPGQRSPFTWGTQGSGVTSSVQGLGEQSYLTVSAQVESPVGMTSQARVLNASYSFSGFATYGSLTSSPLPAVTGFGLAAAVPLLLSPEWLPWVRQRTRTWRAIAGGGAFGSAREWSARHRTLIASVAGALALYAVLAFSFGGHPYDSWSFKVWTYSIQVGGLKSLYIRPEFVGDAVVRGGAIPWGSAGFGYGPVAAYLFATFAPIVPPLGGYSGAAALNADFVVTGEIKWLLSLFAVAAGVALFYGVRRASGRTDLGMIAFALLVLNPAIGFDSAIWGETDSVFYLLFVLFAIGATYRPTLAMVVAGVAIAFKETGPLLLFPSILLILGPGILGVERLRRLAFLAATLLLVTVPTLLAGLLPSVLFSSYTGFFSDAVAGGTASTPVVSADTYTIWTLFTGDTGGIGRLLVPSSDALIAGVSFAILGTVVLILGWLGMWVLVRRSSRSQSLAFWLATSSFAAITFTALLTGTASRYYTLGIPGLAGVLALAWDQRDRVYRRLAWIAYGLATAISFWTMYGLFTYIMQNEYPNIRGLGLSYNPVSRFIATWYLNGVVITAGSIAAVALVLTVSWLTVRLRAGPADPDRASPAVGAAPDRHLASPSVEGPGDPGWSRPSAE
jgi:hypothetical protein